MRTLRVGVVGCGGIAQMMHLPHLRMMPERFDIVALCDADAWTLERVGARFGVATLYDDVAKMVGQATLDAALVLTSGDHAAVAQQVLDAGLHAFVEKPLAFARGDAERIVQVAHRRGLALMVGMMKRYDPAFPLALAEVRRLRGLRYVEAHVLHPEDTLYWSHHGVIRPSPLPVPGDCDTYPAAVSSAIAGAFGQALRLDAGTDDESVLTARFLLFASAIHDVNLIRATLGEANEVTFAEQWAGGTSFTFGLRYPGDILATYAWSLLPELKHYEERISFNACDGRVAMTFPSPYLRNQPTLVSVDRMQDGALSQSTLIASHEEAFKLELEHFYDVVTQGEPCRSDGDDYLRDAALLHEVGRLMAARAKAKAASGAHPARTSQA